MVDLSEVIEKRYTDTIMNAYIESRKNSITAL